MARIGCKTFLLTATLLCLGAIQANADDELPVPPPELVYCSTCHGMQLMGNPIIQAPRLSGMETWYIEKQLKSFKEGWRGGHEGDDKIECEFATLFMTGAKSQALDHFPNTLAVQPKHCGDGTGLNDDVEGEGGLLGLGSAVEPQPFVHQQQVAG